ncbi:MAG TPA: histidine phosphatase family protein [Nocardioidaceae bacterium]|nr:histidine phosphatase family protein [Nocardioidaceae bacterium]
MTASRVLRVYLVRHGQSTWNVEGRVQGQTHHVPLTGVGLTQARDVATRLAKAPIQRLYTSDLLRAVQTAEQVARAIGVKAQPESRLRERSYGVLEGRPNHEVPMLGRRDDGEPPGGESFRAVVRRVGGLLDECLADAARHGLDGIAMVTHGDTIQAALSCLKQDDNDTANGLRTPGNGSIIAATVELGRPQQPVSQRLSR